ncbi:MAG: redox-sensing transcriptional repressor Rex [Candidatus Tritonobacter lacicola]|nr:redox-sensing transcriptional repressor Rex [Candidatus Tritonobacter lacicola]
MRIPRTTIHRLSIYLRCLHDLREEKSETISSEKFASLVGVKPTQLRKDLAYFGQFGTRGRGYDVDKLASGIVRILGTGKIRKVAIVGVGSLGSALLSYRGFSKRGFEVAVAFDMKAGKIGRRSRWPEILPATRMAAEIKKRGIKIAVIAVPATAAQKVADKLVAAGVRAILNFAPTRLFVPRGVSVESVDLAMGLEGLAYSLKSRGRSQ